MPEKKYSVIALDLDGTLLNDKKELSPRSREALTRAAEAGIEIVPTTGRFYKGMPECIRELPFLHYAITINGAEVVELATGKVLYSAAIPTVRAIEVMELLDTLPVIYDCYSENWGYMTASLYEKSGEYALTEPVLRMLLDLRKPVPELKSYLKEHGANAQKIQCFFHTVEERKKGMEFIASRLPDMNVCSSIPNNVEINHPDANKGSALAALCAYLGVPVASSVSFGDGTNDLSMIRTAGLGVAMSNADPAVLAAADAVTLSNNEDGVAVLIENTILKA